MFVVLFIWDDEEDLARSTTAKTHAEAKKKAERGADEYEDFDYVLILDAPKGQVVSKATLPRTPKLKWE
jgi:heme-degrading monooxygenase HmoA